MTSAGRLSLSVVVVRLVAASAPCCSWLGGAVSESGFYLCVTQPCQSPSISPLSSGRTMSVICRSLPFSQKKPSDLDPKVRLPFLSLRETEK